MTSRSKAMLGIWALALDLVLGLWLWRLDPEGARRLLPVVILAALWVYVEAAQGPPDTRRRAIIDWHRTVFATIAVVLALRTGVALAFEHDLLGAEWAPVLRRGFGILGGILLAVWGNYLPKLLSPWHREEQPFDWQRVHRFVGWLAMLSGLGVATVWLALPIPDANRTAAALFLSFAALALVRKLSSLVGFSGRPPVVP